MSIIVQHRRDSRTNCEANTPAAGELWFDTTLKSFRAGDGATLAGVLLGRWGYKYPLSPTQIAADTDNWAPTDFAIAETLFVTSDAARNITGLAGGYAGARRTIINRGAFDITLKNNVTSTAVNRFLFEADVVVRANGAVELQYSVTDSRWMRANGGTKVSSIPQELLLAGYLTPSQITSNQNDYAPTGVTTATVLRLNTDASRNITGIADPREGAIKTIVNVGTNAIVLKDASASSSAANRFDFGIDVTLSAKQAVTIRYDGTDSRWKLLASTAGTAVSDGAVTAVKLAASAIEHGAIVNGYLEWTVAGSALTVAVKTLAGTDPSASDPVYVWVRSATAAPATGTPTYAQMAITAALSATLSSGSSAGTVNSTAFRLWAVLFNDAGTARIGIINCVSGTPPSASVFPLSAWSIASSTAEGGAGAADNAQVFYTGTAVAAKAYALLGNATWESGLATAGTWSAGPTRMQVYGPGVPLPGAVVQTLRTQSGALATGTTVIPNDDTIPQSTEGDQYFSQAIIPSSACHLLRPSWNLMLSNNTGVRLTVALFQDSTAGALAAHDVYQSQVNGSGVVAGSHLMLAGTTSSTTLKIRAGSNAAGTTTLNGTNASRLYGGVGVSHLQIEEIAA